MSTPEQLQPPIPDWGMHILAYFYDKPSETAQWDHYFSRGLIPTNNLRQYIRDDAPKELAPGIGNPYYWPAKPFAPAIAAFRENHPDLWQKAIESDRAWIAARDADVAASLQTRASDPFLSDAYKTACQEYEEVFDRVIRLLQPDLQAIGIDPLDVCI